MTALTEVRLKQFSPRITHDILGALTIHNSDEVLVRAGITTALRLQHFMGQCFVESGGFTTLTENLNYSATRLRQVWPRKFPSISVAQQYAGNPMKLANFIYGGRLGNIKPGDGWAYRGSGLLQTTGLYNFQQRAKQTHLDLVNHPDLARDPSTALLVSALMWQALGCNNAADDDDVERVTRLVNGGENGLDDRISATERAGRIFVEAPKSSHSAMGFFDPLPMLAADDPQPDAAPVTYSPMTPTLSETKPAAVPLTMQQAKLLQQNLKDNGYAPGDIDGNISSPATMGAIAHIQAQQGLPVTGIVDDATEDAIQNATPKIVSEERASETKESLKAKGSVIIEAADSTKNAANGVAAAGGGLVVTGAGSILSNFNDQADAIKSTTDRIPGLSDRLGGYLSSHWQVLVLLIFGALLFFFASRIHSRANTVVNERVRKAQTGEDQSI